MAKKGAGGGRRGKKDLKEMEQVSRVAVIIKPMPAREVMWNQINDQDGCAMMMIRYLHDDGNAYNPIFSPSPT